MTNERAAKIILDLIDAGETEHRNFSVEEIMALKKAYVVLNPEPITNADRIRAMIDEELAVWIAEMANCSEWCILNEQCRIKEEYDGCVTVWFNWLRQEV